MKVATNVPLHLIYFDLLKQIQGTRWRWGTFLTNLKQKKEILEKQKMFLPTYVKFPSVLNLTENPPPPDENNHVSPGGGGGGGGGFLVWGGWGGIK